MAENNLFQIEALTGKNSLVETQAFVPNSWLVS